MKLRYLRNVVTLRMDPHLCNGCRVCTIVCPHAVFAMDDGKSRIVDRDGCMECGACAQELPNRRDIRRVRSRLRVCHHLWSVARNRAVLRLPGTISLLRLGVTRSNKYP